LVERLEDLLRKGGYLVETTSDIERLAAEAAGAQAAGRLRCVVSAGGDGTVALVANHVAPETPLSILPLGTENLLSKQLGYAADPEQLAETVRRGQITRMDAGIAGERLFLLMVGCGFDAEVVQRLHRERRGHIRHLSYAKPILDSIRSYKYPELRVTCRPAKLPSGDKTNASAVQEEVTLSGRWVFVVNLPRYAAGLQIAPDACGDDGLLDVCTFKRGSLWSGLRYLGGVMLGQHKWWEDFVTHRAERIRIESDAQVPYQLDGDPGGVLPLDIRVLPARVTFLVPSSRSASMGAPGDVERQDGA
jgi:diacylglycerol kinase family enzyme